MSAKTSIVVAEFDGHEMQFTQVGWFNATAAAAKFGKVPAKWLELPSTISYLKAFERKYPGIGYLKTKRGNNGGTWLHPKLAVPFARWCDDDFAVWADDQIDMLIREEHPHFDHLRARHAAAASNKYLRSMIERVRESDGKETKAHHYINECTLVNFIVSGEYVGLDRDAMSLQVLDFLAEAEGYNAMLYARDKSREDRIKMLAKFRRNWIAEHGELPELVLADHPKLEARTISKGLRAAAKPRKLKAAAVPPEVSADVHEPVAPRVDLRERYARRDDVR